MRLVLQSMNRSEDGTSSLRKLHLSPWHALQLWYHSFISSNWTGSVSGALLSNKRACFLGTSFGIALSIVLRDWEGIKA
jgi:hypothetical protein